MKVQPWVVLSLSALMGMFTIGLITITLLLVHEIRDDEPVDHTKLDFVEVGNWILAGLIAGSFVAYAYDLYVTRPSRVDDFNDRPFASYDWSDVE